MIAHEVAQGTPEWTALRLGIPTASEFHKIITPGGKPSGSRLKYMGRLIAERLLNESLGADLDGLIHVENGKLLEPKAAKAFAYEWDIEPVQIGFVTTDDGRWGASPDRLVGVERDAAGRIVSCQGCLEIKCPAPQTHCYYSIEGFNAEYNIQVQGQMLVCECLAAARYSYNPRLPSVTTPTPRNEAFIRQLQGELTRFSDDMERELERQRASGFFQANARLPSAVDQAYDGSLHDYTIIGAAELPNTMMAG